MQAKTEKEGKEKEVAAAEDLMREHGILRRTLLVYGEAATRLTQRPDSVSPEALQRGAKLFRSFGEEYHEKQLEEAFICCAAYGDGGPWYIPTAEAYPQGGYEITASWVDPASEEILQEGIKHFLRL